MFKGLTILMPKKVKKNTDKRWNKFSKKLRNNEIDLLIDIDSFISLQIVLEPMT